MGMTAYLGPLGSLIPFKTPSVLSIEPASRSTLRRVLDGAVFEQRGPRGRRAWDVSLNLATPEQVRELSALVDGFYGPPPWAFVDPWSKITNMMSPTASFLNAGTWGGTGVTQGGAGFTADGIRYGRSINVPASTTVILGRRNGVDDFLPVVPGVPVTASFYCSGPGQVRIEFFNNTGTFISNATGTAVSGTGVRAALTVTPPANAASARVSSINATQVELLAFTWTDAVMPWSPGEGATKCTVDGLSKAVRHAATGQYGLQRLDISFKVEELG